MTHPPGLKPCPFCFGGGRPLLGYQEPRGWGVNCLDCGAEVVGDTPQAVLSAWNHRAAPAGGKRLTDEQCNRIRLTLEGLGLDRFWHDDCVAEDEREFIRAITAALEELAPLDQERMK